MNKPDNWTGLKNKIADMQNQIEEEKFARLKAEEEVARISSIRDSIQDDLSRAMVTIAHQQNEMEKLIQNNEALKNALRAVL